MYWILYGTHASVELDILKCQALPPTARFSLRQVIMQAKVDWLCEAWCVPFLFSFFFKESNHVHPNLKLWRLAEKDKAT